MRTIHLINRQGFSIVPRVLRLATISTLIVALLFLINACTPKTESKPSGLVQLTVEFETTVIHPDAEISPLPKSSFKSNECPGLDSQLYQLTQAEDPSGSAGKLGFKVKEDKVQILLTLKDENTTFLTDFSVEVGTQSGTQVHAYVPFDQLCTLANMDAVLAIRPVAQAIQ